jgi:hypothetical protein
MAYARVDFNSWTEQEYGVHIEAIAIGAKVLAEDPETGDAKRGYFEGVVCRFANHCFNEA